MDATTINRDSFLEAQRLADQNLGRCRGACKQIKSATDLVVVLFRDTIVMSVCPDCFESVDMLASMTVDGLNLKLIRKASVVVVG